MHVVPAAPPTPASSVLTTPSRLPLGTILVDRQLISPGALSEGLRQHKALGVPLGEALVAAGAVPANEIESALAEQAGIGMLDIAAQAPDHALDAGVSPADCIRHHFIPWRRFGRRLILAIADPVRRDEVLAALKAQPRDVIFALASRNDVDDAIARRFAAPLADRAVRRCPAPYSSRNWGNRGHGRLMLAVLALGALAAVFPPAALALLLGLLFLLNLSTTILRAAAFAIFLRRQRSDAQRNHAPDGAVSLAAARQARQAPRNRVSVLVPLYRERAVLNDLVAALERSTYPRALLDVIFVLEADDAETEAAVAACRMPSWIRVLRVPPGPLRTKPRALNFALPFCRGDIVGIYDAEDRPEPDQIARMVAHLEAAPPEVACVQGYLDFYNTGQNWLSRCFALEYAMWFRVLLHGVQRLGIPIPLGGTSVFLRRRVLEEVGAWDAHNVTEDADLGFRLARFGYRCEMVPTTTYEEANCRLSGWIGQRARWLKGYGLTWATHSARPLRLWRELGPKGFAGLQIILLGSVASFLAEPVLWAVWLCSAFWDLPGTSPLVHALWTGFIATTVFGQLLILAIGASAADAIGRRRLIPVVLTLPAYWMLGAVAAYRALAEAFIRPFHWVKTEHGLASGQR